MQCERCQQNEASVHLTQVVDGQVAKMHLCEACAKEAGVDIKGTLSITDLLSGLHGLQQEPAPAPVEETAGPECPSCGLTRTQFKKQGRLGCPGCYEAFTDDLRGMIRTMHHHERHVGKRPGGAVPDAERAALRKALDAAIAQERFEEAARLRDRLRAMDRPTGEEEA